MKIRKKMKEIYLISALITALVWLLSGCAVPDTAAPIPVGETAEANFASQSGASIHFIDVGQADCILIQADGEAMLIDSGNRSDGDDIIAYLTANNIESLKYIIATHPHEDHIGSMAQIIQSYPVEEIIMPPKEHTTKTFERLLTAIEENDLSLTQPVQGSSYGLGAGRFTIVSADKDYQNNLNDWSVAILFEYGSVRFLSCGDLESSGEKDILASGADIRADIYKVSHHGSNTSSSDDFLSAIAPSYGIIMCGRDNDYGHPHQEVIDRLHHHNTVIYRTDLQGTVIAGTDGASITISFVPVVAAAETEGKAEDQSPIADTDTDTQPSLPVETAYILNLNTKKIHLPSCPHAASIKEDNKQSIHGTYEPYIAQGYEPCKVCNP